MRTMLHKFALASGIVALDGGAVVMTAVLLFGIALTTSTLAIVLIGMLLVFPLYHFNRKSELEADAVVHPQRVKLIKEVKILDKLAVFSLFMLFPIAYLGSQTPFKTILILALMGLVVMLYSIPWLPKKLGRYVHFRRLKEVPVLKNVLTSVTWGFLAFLTAAFYGLGITSLVFFIFATIFIRGMINTITFDIRDVTADKIYGVITIPVALGINKTKIILYSLNIFFGIFILFSVNLGYLPYYALPMVLLTFYGIAYVYKAGKEESHFLYDVVVDAESLFWPLLLLAGQFFLHP